MNFGEWKAQLVERPGFSGYSLYLYRYLPTGEVEHLQAGGGIVTTSKIYAAKDEPEAFAILTDDMLQQIANAFAAKGIRTISDHKNEGLLEATKAHLDDMRTLVFDKKKGK